METKSNVINIDGKEYNQEDLDDWGSEDFTVIDAAISAADTFTG